MNGISGDDTRRGGDHVVIQNFGHERERPRNANVAFDNAELVVLKEIFHFMKNNFQKMHTFAISWILNGPLILKASPIFTTIRVISLIVASFKSWGGVTKVASPEWTPAFSTCSLIAIHSTRPSAATASTSISWKKKFYNVILEIKTVYLRIRNEFWNDDRLLERSVLSQYSRLFQITF